MWPLAMTPEGQAQLSAKITVAGLECHLPQILQLSSTRIKWYTNLEAPHSKKLPRTCTPNGVNLIRRLTESRARPSWACTGRALPFMVTRVPSFQPRQGTRALYLGRSATPRAKASELHTEPSSMGSSSKGRNNKNNKRKA